MTPSHDGKYFHNYVISLMGLINVAQQSGLAMDVFLHRGESLVTRARNNCVADFLANPNWTHLFWIDSDIGFSPQAALRLLLSDYDIAAGVYPLKTDRWPKLSSISKTANSAPLSPMRMLASCPSLALGVAVTHCRPSRSGAACRLNSACRAFRSGADAINAAGVDPSAWACLRAVTWFKSGS